LGTILSSDLVKKPEEVQIEDYNQKYRDNVFAMKKWGPNGSHTPFFITLGHHFWNMLIGHAESLPFIFDQKTGKESGFTDAGWELLDDLLSDLDENEVPKKTRRILIDVKHMSPKARKQYYNYLAKKKRFSDLNIPVVCSHASVGDAPSLNYFIKGTEDYKSGKTKNYFNTSSLSLNDEDIKVIIDSDGIIGIVLHEGRIASKDAMKKNPYRIAYYRKKIKRSQNDIEDFQSDLQKSENESDKKKLLNRIKVKMQQIDEFGEKMQEGFVNMILANIYKIVEVYAKHKPQKSSRAWDHIGIGSDFDGMINKMDYLGTANEFPKLNELLVKFLKNPQALFEFNQSWTVERLKALQFNFSAEDLTDKIMSKNADDFLQKYFNEDYLINGINPQGFEAEQLIS